ncbi:hypothetical protein [Paenibacillus polymyxa]|uniref:hypothetical protein n=1 Tax=Paenibacillus polymyxa TaxID=1406 RepID=UPI0008FB017F|nr:hypothetical protein [Paenibacillus polymyxa]APB75626.1 outer membrane assembly protein AsmA [Paenibacillus polymyxa]POR25539.1 hypothetical protein CG775_21705 [Paenibacillus polymyxa]
MATNKILTTETYYEEIRGRLGVGEDVISDADIDALSVLPIGESRIIKAVPDYAVLTGDDQTYVYAATVCMVAAILAPSMTARIKKSKKDFDFSFENQVVDWKKYAVQLVDEVYEFIESISTVQQGTNVPVFGVAGPTRTKEGRRY